MAKYRHYIKYIGQYVKRFYTPFSKGNIFKIIDYREVVYFEDDITQPPISEFCYQGLGPEFSNDWRDVEDSVIITNEKDEVEDIRIANINNPTYKGFNPFKL